MCAETLSAVFSADSPAVSVSAIPDVDTFLAYRGVVYFYFNSAILYRYLQVYFTG